MFWSHVLSSPPHFLQIAAIFFDSDLSIFSSVLPEASMQPAASDELKPALPLSSEAQHLPRILERASRYFAEAFTSACWHLLRVFPGSLPAPKLAGSRSP